MIVVSTRTHAHFLYCTSWRVVFQLPFYFLFYLLPTHPPTSRTHIASGLPSTNPECFAPRPFGFSASHENSSEAGGSILTINWNIDNEGSDFPPCRAIEVFVNILLFSSYTEFGTSNSIRLARNLPVADWRIIEYVYRELEEEDLASYFVFEVRVRHTNKDGEIESDRHRSPLYYFGVQGKE